MSRNRCLLPRSKAKIHPLRLYVDQDAVDFLKKFFSFKDPNAPAPSNPDESQEAYIRMWQTFNVFGGRLFNFTELAEIFPIDLKLDYKPRRVDYKALKEGRTIELMNFFHFDGAEMTLRHITMAGVSLPFLCSTLDLIRLSRSLDGHACLRC